jgi:protein-tyrosine phosphatase
MGAATVRVVVETDGPDLSVRWDWEPKGSSGDVEIGLGSSPDARSHTHRLRVPAGELAARLTDVPAGRAYVSVSYDGTVVVAAERRVRFDGAPNFRDLGGYPTATGGRTRWGRVFRSSSLHRLTADDITILDGLGVRTIYDLRRDDEQTREPGPRPIRSLPVPLRFSEPPPDLSRLRERADGERWLFDDYEFMLANGGPVYGSLLSSLATDDGTPAVFHCAGGKDRTGLAAALLLTWLGVDRETVLDDYELTGQYLAAQQSPEVVARMLEYGIGRDAAEALLSSPRWVMARALELVDSEYGGIEAYLRGPAELSDRTLSDLRTGLVD